MGMKKERIVQLRTSNGRGKEPMRRDEEWPCEQKVSQNSGKPANCDEDLLATNGDQVAGERAYRSDGEKAGNCKTDEQV